MWGLGASILRVRDLARVKGHMQDRGKRLALDLGGLCVFPLTNTCSFTCSSPSPSAPSIPLRSAPFCSLQTTPFRPTQVYNILSIPLHCLLSSHCVSPRHRGEQYRIWSLSCSCIWRQAMLPSSRLPWSLPEPWGLGLDTSCPKSPSLAMSLDITGQVLDGVRVEGRQGSPPTADE